MLRLSLLASTYGTPTTHLHAPASSLPPSPDSRCISTSRSRGIPLAFHLHHAFHTSLLMPLSQVFRLLTTDDMRSCFRLGARALGVSPKVPAASNIKDVSRRQAIRGVPIIEMQRFQETHFPLRGFCNVPSVSFDEFRRFCAEGKLYEALDTVYLRLQHVSSVSFSITLNCLLQSCIRYRNLQVFNDAYSLIVKYGFETDPFLATSLIRMYAANGSLTQVDLVFGKLHEPDVVTWSAFISAHSKHGEFNRVISLYHKLKLSKVIPDGHLFVALLKACADSATMVALTHGRLIHSHVIERGLGQARFVNNALINMYGRCNALEDAKLVFASLAKKDHVTWSTMIGACLLHGFNSQAFHLFQKMQTAGHHPDQITCVNALKASCGVAALADDLKDAKTVFELMPTRDTVAWGAIIAGCTFNNKYQEALQHYNEMIFEGLKPNDIILLSVLCACSQTGLWEQADAFFNLIRQDFGLNATKEHINCIVNILGQTGHIKEAEKILRHGPFKPNIVGWTSLLNNCKVFSELEVGKQCFDEIVEIDCRDASPYALMSDIYVAVGLPTEAENMKNMKQNAQAWKTPGKAFIYVNDTGHEFTVRNTTNAHIFSLNTKLQTLNAQLRNNGHVPLQDVSIA